jgi:phage terminase large subunit-like protein
MAEAGRSQDLTRGERVCLFIERYCMVPEGKLVGQPMRLLPFQETFIQAIYDNPTPTRRAYLSIARKSGKTALIACLLLAHICGPEAVTNAQLISGATSRDQASLVFQLAVKILHQSPRLTALCHVLTASKSIHGLICNTHYRALSADATRAHGQSPVLAILDEIGQLIGPTNPFIDAVTTSQGAHERPLLLAISTSAASDADLFNVWIDDARRSQDPGTVCHVYKAMEGCDLMDESQWADANPALGVFRSKDDLRDQLTRASRIPSLENSARNLLLNQRVSLDTLWLAPTAWYDNRAKPDEAVYSSGVPVSLGLDLSMRQDLTAAVLAAKDEADVVHLKTYAFTPRQGLAERALRDRAPYETWVKQGFLYTTPGTTVSYREVVSILKSELERLNCTINTLEFDRWRWREFRLVCEQEEFDYGEAREVGQGFRDMSPRIETFEEYLLEGKIRHGNHPVLNLGASNAIVETDHVKNRRLAKNRSTNRIDALVAATMALYGVASPEMAIVFDTEAIIG